MQTISTASPIKLNVNSIDVPKGDSNKASNRYDQDFGKSYDEAQITQQKASITVQSKENNKEVVEKDVDKKQQVKKPGSLPIVVTEDASQKGLNKPIGSNNDQNELSNVEVSQRISTEDKLKEEALNLETIKNKVQDLIKKLKDKPELLNQLDDGSSAFTQLKTLIQGNDLSALFPQSGEGLPHLPSAELEGALTKLDDKSGDLINSPYLEGGAPNLLFELKHYFKGLAPNNMAAKGASLDKASENTLISAQSWSNSKTANNKLEPPLKLDAKEILQKDFDGLLPDNFNKNQKVNSQFNMSLLSKNQTAQGLPVTLDTLNQSASDFSNLLDSSALALQPSSSKLISTDLQPKLIDNGLRQYSTLVNQNLSDSNWSSEVGQKVVWFTGKNIQSAEIRLNPAELGPIEIKIKVHSEGTSVNFHAQHAVVRDLLELNMPRLRDMLVTNGVDVADVNVDSGNQDQSYRSQDQHQGESRHFSGGSDQQDQPEDNDVPKSTMHTTSVNLVDYFA